MTPFFRISPLYALAASVALAEEAKPGLADEEHLPPGMKARVIIEDFTGSTGATAAKVVRRDLEITGDFIFEPAPEAFKVTAVSSGGRINGTLHGPDGKEIFSETYDSLNLKLNAHQFSDEIASAIFGRPGVASTQIAFVSNASGHKEIYLCDADGSNIRQVTKDNSLCVSPHLRSDALLLAFTSYVSGYPDIYLVDLVSGNRRRIINAPGTNSGCAFSPGGDRVAMTMSFAGNPELYVSNSGGNGGSRITRTRAIEASPSWAPDGVQIIYAANHGPKPQLYVSDLETRKTELVPVGRAYCADPDWSPDGDRIVFTSIENGKSYVAVHQLSTGKTRTIAEGQNPCWGADSRHILYATGAALIVENIDSKTRRVIVQNFGTVSEPSWSR